MNALRTISGSLIAVGLVSLCGPNASAQQYDDAEILNSGPIHEAYASTTSAEREPTEIVRKRPPEAIDELPPDQKPVGDNVTWISGYWAWDDDRTDFIWVSGVWRDLPPDRQWIPGYWADAAGGYQYVPGYWEDVGRSTTEYLPPPPERIDVGANSPSPGVNYVWAPGSWVYVNRSYDYAWQPGYWVVTQPDWIWTPAHYVWTPRGYIFIAGYWDYDLPRRGVCYAPVYYHRPYYQRAGYYYTPRLAIDITIAIGHFFIRPRSCHYYFGDYYGDRYRRRGYDPWYSIHERRDRYYHYDPIFVTYRSRELRRDRDWDRHMDERYEYRRQHTDARPPRTVAAMEQIERQPRRSSVGREDLVIAKSIEEVTRKSDQQRQLTPVDMDRRRELQARSRDVEEFRTERRQTEARPQTDRAAEQRPATKSPIREESVGRSTAPRPKTPPPGAQRAETRPERDATRPITTRESEGSPSGTQQRNERNLPSPRETATAPPSRPTPQQDNEIRRTQPAPNEQRRQPERSAQPQPQQRVSGDERSAPTAQQRVEQPRQPEQVKRRPSPVAAKPNQSTRPVPERPKVPQADASRRAEPPRDAQQPERSSGQGRGRGQQE